jgi:8-oxo-dGTP pyrophosphatase MutT (NUDIX family)
MSGLDSNGSASAPPVAALGHADHLEHAELEKPVTPNTYAIVGTQVPFIGKIISVRIDSVVMPGGEVALREAVHHHQAVAVVAIDDEDRVVLVGQYRNPFRRRFWELPAGLLDIEGEDALETAKRELGEEVGIAASDWQLLLEFVPSPGIMDESIRIYLARGLTDIGRQGEISHEEADLVIVRVPLETAVAAIFRGDIVNGPAVSGILAARTALSGDVALRPADLPWDTAQGLIRPEHEPLQPAPPLH